MSAGFQSGAWIGARIEMSKKEISRLLVIRQLAYGVMTRRAVAGVLALSLPQRPRESDAERHQGAAAPIGFLISLPRSDSHA